MSGLPLQNYSLVTKSDFTLRRIFNQPSTSLKNYNQNQINKNGNKTFDSSYTIRYNQLLALLKNRN